MKTFLFTLMLGILSGIANAQTSEIKIGRHGACNSGRGICGIETQATSKTNNAQFIKDIYGNIILRLYKSKLSLEQIERLFGKSISQESDNEILQIEQAFALDSKTKNAMHESTGILLNLIVASNFEALISEHFIDVILIKSKS
ncbi:MAG: hypothetical protein ABJM06_10430 [Gilvibacter sp.]